MALIVLGIQMEIYSLEQIKKTEKKMAFIVIGIQMEIYALKRIIKTEFK